MRAWFFVSVFAAACSTQPAHGLDGQGSSDGKEDSPDGVTQPGRPAYYVYFTTDRERINEAWFLDSHNIVGAQLRYNWKHLETAEGVYDLDLIQNDLDFLTAHGKKLWIAIEDATFDPTRHNSPAYLIQDPKYHGGEEKTFNDASVHEGWVSRRWDPAVAARRHQLYAVLGSRFDGLIAGINGPESAISVTTPNFVPEGYTDAKYRDAVIAAMDAMAAAFPNSIAMEYANFMPGGGEIGEGYLGDVIEHAVQTPAGHPTKGMGIGGPDLKVNNPHHLEYGYIKQHAGELPTGLAVQDGNCEYIDPTTGNQVTIPQVLAYAEHLGLDYLFWGLEQPYLDQFVEIVESVP